MEKIVVPRLKANTQRRRLRRILFGGLLVVAQAFLLWAPRPGGAQQSYEAYYRYLGDYPADANPGWHEGAQGLAHDRNNWFITQTRTGCFKDSLENVKLWKIPVTHDLNKEADCRDPGMGCQTMNDWPTLKAEGYTHLGDPDYYEFGGRGYVLVPVEGGRPAIAAFRADTLQYVNHAYLTEQTSASWCAVDPDGCVYSSDFFEVARVNKYCVDWNAFLTSSGPLELKNPKPVSLSDVIHDVQGGEISPSGQLLYLTAGYPEHRGDSSHGMHVFDLSTGKRIQCSANPNDSGGRKTQCSTNAAGLFTFEFDEGRTTQEELEGLTIWDLDDGRAPGIRGQLHVLLTDNDCPSADEVYLKHYTNTIYVDKDYTWLLPGKAPDGTIWRPLKTVTSANSFAWDGARIKIKAGSYSELLTFSKQVEVIASGGTVSLGK